MKKKSIIVTVVLFTLATAILSGCGTTGNNATGNQGTDGQTAEASDIGKEKAQEIAFADAGVNEADISGLRVSRETEDGVEVYEVKFTDSAAAMEYDYEIQVSDGTIRKVEKDKVNDKVSGEKGEVTISKEDAMKLALDKVPGATEKEIRIKLDQDNGYYKYEGDIVYEGKEYDFEIDANSGEILEWTEKTI